MITFQQLRARTLETNGKLDHLSREIKDTNGYFRTEKHKKHLKYT